MQMPTELSPCRPRRFQVDALSRAGYLPFIDVLSQAKARLVGLSAARHAPGPPWSGMQDSCTGFTDSINLKAVRLGRWQDST